MNKKRWIVLCAILILVMFLLLKIKNEKRRSIADKNLAKTEVGGAVDVKTPDVTMKMSNADAAASLESQEKIRESGMLNTWIMTPISFYGKVIDEHGSPVEGADIEASYAKKYGGERSVAVAQTDHFGMFHISGHGMAVIVDASKTGYYRTTQSGGAFIYVDAGGRMEKHEDASSPAVFVLRKMGSLVPLLELDRQLRISKDGTPVELSMTTGKAVAAGSGDIRIECRTNDGNSDPRRNDPYDWHCSISVNGGGLIHRDDQFNFEAPTEGYQNSDEIDMPASKGVQWRSQVTRDYFAVLKNNTYARIEFEITAGGDHYFEVKAFVNPVPGERNLQPDISRTVKIR